MTPATIWITEDHAPFRLSIRMAAPTGGAPATVQRVCVSVGAQVAAGTLMIEPTDRELTKATAMLATAQPEDRRTTLEDIFWSLMGSKEFLFNH